MKKSIHNSIQYEGVESCHTELENLGCNVAFKQGSTDFTAQLKECQPSIEEIMKVRVETCIQSVQTIVNVPGTSLEGQNLTGYGALVTSDIVVSIYYCSKEDKHAIHKHTVVVPLIEYVSIPEKYAGRGFLKAELYIEDIKIHSCMGRDLVGSMMTILLVQSDCELEEECQAPKQTKDHPLPVRYFKEILLENEIKVPEDRPQVADILDIMQDICILNKKLVTTERGVSEEGQLLSGLKLDIKYCWKEKISYIGSGCSQPVTVIGKDTIGSAYIILPEQFGNRKTATLLNCNRLYINSKIEYGNARVLSGRTIQSVGLLYFEVNEV